MCIYFQVLFTFALHISAYYIIITWISPGLQNNFLHWLHWCAELCHSDAPLHNLCAPKNSWHFPYTYNFRFTRFQFDSLLIQFRIFHCPIPILLGYVQGNLMFLCIIKYIKVYRPFKITHFVACYIVPENTVMTDVIVLHFETIELIMQ